MDEKQRKKAKSLLIEVAFLYLGLVVFMFALQRHMIYVPDVTRPVPASFGAGDMSVIDVKTSDGLTLQGWYKAPAAGKPVIVLFHGNGGNIGYRAYKVRGYIDQGYGVLLAEYRGYGGNPGSPSEDGFYNDARAYISWLAQQGIKPARIVLYGESIGTGVAVQMASETPGYKAIVLESPFASLAAVAQKHYFFLPVALLIKDRYDSIAKIAAVKIPLLVVHGVVDNIVPYDQGKQLFDAANAPKKMETIPLGGHNDLYMHGAGPKILFFLEGLKA